MSNLSDGTRLTCRDRVRITLRYADGTTEEILGPVMYYDQATGQPVTDPERIARADQQYEEDKQCPS